MRITKEYLGRKWFLAEIYFQDNRGEILTEFEICQKFKMPCMSMVIDRKHLEQYGGIFREIEIFTPTKCCIDFTDKSSKLADEGGGIFWFTFGSFEIMIKQLERYTEKNISEWKRYFTEPAIFNNEALEWNQKSDWKLFEKDLSQKKIAFPEGYLKMEITSEYWQNIYNGNLTEVI